MNYLTKTELNAVTVRMRGEAKQGCSSRAFALIRKRCFSEEGRAQVAVLASAVFMSVLAADASRADDIALSSSWKTPILTTHPDWTGLYVGGHAAYGRGDAGTSSDLGSALTQGRFGALYAGVQAGYNYMLPSGIVIGAEADISFPNYLNNDDVVWSGVRGPREIIESIDYIGTLRARLGYAVGGWLLYGTGGFAWSSGHFLGTDVNSGEEQSRSRLRTGWALGGGIEYALQTNWSARLEYIYSRFGTSSVLFPAGPRYASDFDIHMLRLGLNYHLDAVGASPKREHDASSLSGSDRWEIHGQTTYVLQGYPRFRAPYSGDNSLPPWSQSKSTWTASAFLGVKLWDGAELYYNPELLQGFGLSSTVGVGGFPNGEAQKSDFLYPRYNTSRLFLRQTFELGGEQETIESDYGQMAGKKDISRVTVQVGKFAVHDVFDGNTYAQDPRVDFLNWSIWAAGAFDYPADRVGLTYGAVVELNQLSWAMRGGYFLIGNEPNANNFDMALFRRGAYVAEWEQRYILFSRPGKLRLTGWLHESYSGSYRNAVDLVSASPGLDATNAIISSRQGRTKYGYVINLEQALTGTLGIFGRWSWNNGKNEISAFTDIDSSLSMGLSLAGVAWGRPDDKIGVGGAVNGLSKDHRDYLAVGGMGILVGDGRLNYRQERIVEAYYALGVTKNTSLAFDYQFISNPGYNADRGPISVFSARFHSEF